MARWSSVLFVNPTKAVDGAFVDLSPLQSNPGLRFSRRGGKAATLPILHLSSRGSFGMSGQGLLLGHARPPTHSETARAEPRAQARELHFFWTVFLLMHFVNKNRKLPFSSNLMRIPSLYPLPPIAVTTSDLDAQSAQAHQHPVMSLKMSPFFSRRQGAGREGGKISAGRPPRLSISGLALLPAPRWTGLHWVCPKRLWLAIASPSPPPASHKTSSETKKTRIIIISYHLQRGGETTPKQCRVAHQVGKAPQEEACCCSPCSCPPPPPPV